MSDIKQGEEHPRLLPSWGSRVQVQHKDKKQRITEALNDLQLAFAGMASGGDGLQNTSQIIQTTGSLARACSVCLRKTVLGEARNREARLLDKSVLESLDMYLQPLRKIPREERRSIETGFRMEGVTMEITRLDEETNEPKERYTASGGVQGLSIVVEWPLVGMADWTGTPTEKQPWKVHPDQLFDTNSEKAMGCNEWLGQQVVLFDRKGITLGKLIRTVVNFEGAHSVNVGRLSVMEDEAPSRAAKEPHVHILRNISFGGIGYAELVTIETAMYLCKKLLKEPSRACPVNCVSGHTYT